MTKSNITGYRIDHWSDGGRIWIRYWMCKTMYLSLTGERCCVVFDNFGGNCPRYNATALYICILLSNLYSLYTMLIQYLVYMQYAYDAHIAPVQHIVNTPTQWIHEHIHQHYFFCLFVIKTTDWYVCFSTVLLRIEMDIVFVSWQ